MLIAFVHDHKSFLPEIQGYIDFFEKNNVRTCVCTAEELSQIKPDVRWHIMGVDRLAKGDNVIIHEYVSASAPPFPSLKNRLKTYLNTKPDFRLFLNEYVHNSFQFSDDVPFGFRDMGINLSTVPPGNGTEKKYDFVYVGEIALRKIEPLIGCFTIGALSDRSILFLTKNYQNISEKLKRYNNIHFIGPVPSSQVKEYVRAARFGINYVPDIVPFNRQTSTKLLEYAASKVPIVTTDYFWVRDFQRKNGGNFFYLSSDLSNFTWEAVNKNEYDFPDLTEWTWDRQIRKSGVLEFLSRTFNQKWFTTDGTD